MMLTRSSLATCLSPFLVCLALGTAHAQTTTTPTTPSPTPPTTSPDTTTPPPDTTTPPPAPVTTEVPVPAPAPAAAPANPDKLKVAKEGYFTPAILLQGWFMADSSGGAQTDAFKLRRAELHAKGQIIPDKVQYELNIDAAKVLETAPVSVPTTPPTTVNAPQGKISALQDVYLTYLTKNAEISVGQHKIPVSWEGYNSSGKLLFPERAAVSAKFGDQRDIGIRVTKAFPKWMYMAGIYNGTGANQPENNNGKDVSLRLEVYPVKGLMIGAVTYDSMFDRHHPTAKDRWELDARYEKDAILVQAEAIMARDYDASKANTMKNERGLYAAFAYKLPGTQIQPAVRVGALDLDTSLDANAMKDTRRLDIDLGVNYYLQDHNAKLQASYTRTQFGADGKSPDNLFIAAAQIYY